MSELFHPQKRWIFNDKIRKFPSGYRQIIVLELGYKWVRLQCGNKTTRILRTKWTEILIASIKYQNRLAATRKEPDNA